MHKKLFALLLLVFILATPNLAEAQCAMCKAVAETSSGNKAATGLNNGILYLMFIPYVLMASVAVAWYFHRKSGKA
ncbi:MAG: hypothetical protein JJU02_05605 [Cryomorphaceae bacterium]|nr:hypothetical protein [Cryomorphaceae bacterium]